MKSRFLAFSLMVVIVFSVLAIASLTFAPGLSGAGETAIFDADGNVVGYAHNSFSAYSLVSKSDLKDNGERCTDDSQCASGYCAGGTRKYCIDRD